MVAGAPDSARFRPEAFLATIAAQERALTELTGVIERQADTIAGIALVLRALIDTLLEEEQRDMLVSHLELSTAGDQRRARRSIIDSLLD